MVTSLEFCARERERATGRSVLVEQGDEFVGHAVQQRERALAFLSDSLAVQDGHAGFARLLGDLVEQPALPTTGVGLQQDQARGVAAIALSNSPRSAANAEADW